VLLWNTFVFSNVFPGRIWKVTATVRLLRCGLTYRCDLDGRTDPSEIQSEDGTERE
jgi:hypothetical protein